jgi:hypothetical protein
MSSKVRVSLRCISEKIFAVLLSLLIFANPAVLLAQSTQATFLGTVKDASGSVVVGAQVKIKNVDEGVSRTFTTDSIGNYRAPDFKPGHYKIEVSKSGFGTEVIEDVLLVARQELREDVTLRVGTLGETIEVKDTTAGVINTETASISASFDSIHVLELPANYRAGGSTSPLSMVQSLPGVQADSSGKFSVQGGLPFMSETSVDGITTQDAGGNNPLSNAWPSAETIGELRVDGVNNNAEFGQPGAITTVTKSGTNNYHGSLFWYHQNRALDATPYVRVGTPGKPAKIGNDFGASGGGPVQIPGLYNGHNRTFFYGTFEGFRFPKASAIFNTVPTAAMRNGDFSNVYSGYDPKTLLPIPIAPLNNPFLGGTYAGKVIPSISPIAQKFLSLFPLPNVGNPNIFDGNTNHVQNIDNSYHSNQFDIRGDQYIGTKLQVFARFSWKNIGQAQPTELLLPPSTFIDQYRMLVVSGTYNFRPNLVNEARFGFTRNNNGNTNPFNGPAFAQSLGLNGIGTNNLYFNGVTELDFSNLTSLNVDRLSGINQSNTYQYTDTLSWTKGRHTIKFGGDIRHIQSVSPLGFNGADNYGTFDFSSALFTGNSFADFLLGIPSASFYDTVRMDNNGRSIYYNFYGQDTWQVTPRLTLSYGLRYEYHPGYQDASGNIGNFDPTVAKSGQVIYPDGKASLLDPGFLASFNACPNLTGTGPVINGAPCTPVLSASQAGLPNSLRTAEKLRFMPRIGIAYRPFNNDKTAIRAGFGMYNITTLGAIFYALTGTLQAGTQSFDNQQLYTNAQVPVPNGVLYQWPAYSNGGSGYGPPQYGKAYFGTANDIHFKDPLSEQWNLSFDHELPGGIGVRASYIGMKTTHLVWAPNYNDMSIQSTTPATLRPLSDRPFPNWGRINNRASSANSMYNALQIEANRRFRNGLSFNSAYTFAKNMADNQAHQQSFADENGGSRATYYPNRSLDYGEVYGTRRNRWITTALYDLPIGKGHAFGKNWNTFLNGMVGGWRLSNIFLWQTGPFLTPYFTGGDPSGTGSGTVSGREQYPDQVGNWVPANQNANDWINPGSFVCPGMPSWTPGSPCTIGTGSGPNPLPIGRFGNAKVGSVLGPGMVNLSTGLSKEFAWSERLRLKIGASFTNVLNHTNLADPNLDISSGNFGKIDSARASDFGGNRTGQVSVRLEF